MIEAGFLLLCGGLIGYAIGSWRVGKYRRLSDAAAKRLHEALEYDRRKQVSSPDSD